MPHAVPAASSQPSDTDTSAVATTALEPSSAPAVTARPRGVRRRVFWLIACLALLFPAAAMVPQEAAAARSCTGWTSTSRPPNSIRVLNRNGKVERVDFRRYVGVVMASGEWPSRLPKAVLEAGAVAVKQFAWYHALKGNHRRSFVTPSGKCYDVVSTTRDQMYVPGRGSVSAKQWSAIDATWRLSVRKNGRFILTAYRAGSARRCGADAVGKRIYQRSAKDCARRGHSARQILRTYYGPAATLHGSGGGGGGEQPKADPTPKPTPKAKARPQPQSSAQRRPKPSPRATSAAAPTPEPEVEVVRWWDVALGEQPTEQPERAGPLSEALAQWGGGEPVSGQSIAEAPARVGEIRVSRLGGDADEFPPLIARASPSSSDTASSSTAVSFVGRSLRLAALPGPGGKVVSIYVDGELEAMVDMYWARPYEEAIVFEQAWDDEALHTVELVMLGSAEQLRLELEANQLHY